jgi:hypothetical protein
MISQTIKQTMDPSRHLPSSSSIILYILITELFTFFFKPLYIIDPNPKCFASPSSEHDLFYTGNGFFYLKRIKPSNSDHHELLLTSYEYQALPHCRNRANQRAKNSRETISNGTERECFRFLG